MQAASSDTDVVDADPYDGPQPDTQWSRTMRLLAAFAAGALIGGVSVAQVFPRGAGVAIGDGGLASSGDSADFEEFQGGGEESFGFSVGDGGDAGQGSDGGGSSDPFADGGSTGASTGGSSTVGGTSGGSTSGGASTGGAASGGSSSGGSGSTSGGTSGGSTSGGGSDGSDGGLFGAGGSTSGGSTSGGSTSGGSTSGGSTSGGSTSGGSTSGGSATGGSGSACSREGNGGETDRGVSREEVFLATTVVDSGIGKAFLGDVKYAMEAVRQRVNRAGGICGRLLKITYRDDGWEADRGAQYLNNFINQGVFAIPVGPSSEGVNAVIANDGFKNSKTPVVGTDGLVIRQYQLSEGDKAAQPWVWPVAVATVSNARIMANAAYESGARDFSIVFDRNYKFGQEAAKAFNAEVKRLTGNDIPGYNNSLNCQQAFCGIQAGQSSYSSQVNTWRGNKGDFTALFLEPQTALTWMNDANTPGAGDHRYGAAQTLFTRSFAENCKSRCDQMGVWTGFKPNLGDYRNDAAVQQYINDLNSVNQNADEFNQFVEGGYVGMRLLVAAMGRVGPNLTRDRLKAALDSQELSTGLTLTDPLRFSSDNRYVATKMQRWVIQYKGSFGGWTSGPVAADPRPTAGTG